MRCTFFFQQKVNIQSLNKRKLHPGAQAHDFAREVKNSEHASEIMTMGHAHGL